MKYRVWMPICIMIFLISLVACSKSTDQTTPLKETPNYEKEETHDEQRFIKMLQIPQGGSFEKIYGWIDDETLLFSYKEKGVYYVRSHHLFENDSKLIFSSKAPIINILIHKLTGNLFIHTSPQAHTALVYFTDKDGNITYSTDIESYELSYEWNEDNDNLMMITAFFEDWTYNVLHLDIQSKEIREIKGTQPFLKWINDNEVIEQEWQDDIAFFAPIWKKSLSTNQEERIHGPVYRFDVLGNLLFTIKVPDTNDQVFEYYLQDPECKPGQPFLTVPNLTQYADWLIPYYEYNKQNDTFMTFVPYSHGHADVYDKGYKLIKVNLKNGGNSTILEELENKPLSCNGKGDYCLYGFQFEQLLNIETGEISYLVNQGRNIVKRSEAT